MSASSEDPNNIGVAFWIGTILGGCLLFSVCLHLMDDVFMSIILTSVFCWFFGLFAQVAVESMRTMRSSNQMHRTASPRLSFAIDALFRRWIGFQRPIPVAAGDLDR
jgi:predicted lysophospholipase L1 biosynthesis ABC-type transport system permease subunit